MKASLITLAELSTSVILSPTSSLPKPDLRLVKWAIRSGRLSKPIASLANVREKATIVGSTTSPVEALRAGIP